MKSHSSFNLKLVLFQLNIPCEFMDVYWVVGDPLSELRGPSELMTSNMSSYVTSMLILVLNQLFPLDQLPILLYKQIFKSIEPNTKLIIIQSKHRRQWFILNPSSKMTITLAMKCDMLYKKKPYLSLLGPRWPGPHILTQKFSFPPRL